jgi:uncharacterized protein YndB with AHSA1/START domain
MDTSTANPSFVYVTYIATTPEKLRQALTDGVFTQQYWAGTSIESDWTLEAPVRFIVKGTVHDGGIVLAFDGARKEAIARAERSATRNS